MALCEMCGEAEATTEYVAPVCAPCKRWLIELQGELAEVEATDPALGELAQSIDEAYRRWVDPDTGGGRA